MEARMFSKIIKEKVNLKYIPMDNIFVMHINSPKRYLMFDG
jgi:hypothetical protein